MFGRFRGIRQAERILKHSDRFRNLSSQELLRRSRSLQWEARCGRSLQQLLPDVFALGVEATRRVLGKTHFPVQVQGGLEIFRGRIAEMQTGEGKTLTAILPALLRSLPGRGCHVITANEYLAKRDAELLRPVFAALGTSVACVESGMDDDARREAYSRDVTYGTAGEIGFDFLRDRLKRGADEASPGTADDPAAQPVQRGHDFALVDEADSILIDEARTPLIIGVERPARPSIQALYRWARDAAAGLIPERDFLFERSHRQAHLTEEGCRRITLRAKPLLLDSIDTESIYRHVEQALTALHAFHRDKDYVLVDDAVSIVDEGTGRIMEGRKWQDGLHQAIEAKEHLPITAGTGSAARITIQTLFRHYRRLGGMTGTAAPARRELKRTYRLQVAVIPTNRPCLRQALPPRVFTTQAAKRLAIVREVRGLTADGRAVLIGTPSVEASERLSAAFQEAAIPHQVLNAHNPASEAAIVAEAGRSGRVTIATNMAGRGTDILLEAGVRAAGGLHVLGTEFHSSFRIDRQLVGRAARQGDPGSCQFFLSLEDELLVILGARQRARWARAARADGNGELNPSWVRVFQKVQRRIERLQARQRKQLMAAEREQLKQFRRMGLDPFLELVDR